MDRGKWASNLAVAGATKYHTVTYVSIDYDLLSNLSLSIDTHSYVQQHKLALCLFLLYYLQHIINLLYSSPHVHQRADATPPYTNPNPNPRLAPGFSSYPSSSECILHRTGTYHCRRKWGPQVLQFVHGYLVATDCLQCYLQINSQRPDRPCVLNQSWLLLFWS
jgi:hypothetical protein